MPACYLEVGGSSGSWSGDRGNTYQRQKKVPQNSAAAAQPKEIFFQYYPHKMRFISTYSECLQVVRITFSSYFVVAVSFL